MYFLAIPDMTVFALQSYVRVVQTERNGRYTRGVVRLPRIAKHPRYRGEDHHEVQAREVCSALKRAERVDLRREDAVERLLGVEGKDPIVQQRG